jgi:hypothetical protein
VTEIRERVIGVKVRPRPSVAALPSNEVAIVEHAYIPTIVGSSRTKTDIASLRRNRRRAATTPASSMPWT